MPQPYFGPQTQFESRTELHDLLKIPKGEKKFSLILESFWNENLKDIEPIRTLKCPQPTAIIVPTEIYLSKLGVVTHTLITREIEADL